VAVAVGIPRTLAGHNLDPHTNTSPAHPRITNRSKENLNVCGGKKVLVCGHVNDTRENRIKRAWVPAVRLWLLHLLLHLLLRRLLVPAVSWLRLLISAVSLLWVLLVGWWRLLNSCWRSDTTRRSV
jgi:hypothetical protein